jgi:mannitol-1-phosphate/altronate dehydrogenase
MAGIEVLRKKGMLWDIIVILIALLFEFMGSEDKATPCQEWSAELASEVANRLQRNKVYRPRENISIPEIWKSSKRKSYRSKNYYL